MKYSDIPKAEQLRAGEKLVLTARIVSECVFRASGISVNYLIPHGTPPFVSDRQRRKAEFARLETYLADPVGLETFISVGMPPESTTKQA